MCTGPDRKGIFFSPVVGSEMIHWNYTDSIERNEIQWNDRISYFGFFASSVDNSPYKFFIDIKVISHCNGNELRINIFFLF